MSEAAGGERRICDMEAARAAFGRAATSHSQDFGTFFLARYLGFEISYPGETCRLEFDVREDLHNPRGVLQGGVISTALDVSMGHLVHHLAGSGATVDLNVQFHRPVSAGRLVCRAEVVSRTSSIWFMRATARSDAKKLIASAVASFKLVEKR